MEPPKTNLAIKLIYLEKDYYKQVALLMCMGKYKQAVEVSVKSMDTNLMRRKAFRCCFIRASALFRWALGWEKGIRENKAMIEKIDN